MRTGRPRILGVLSICFVASVVGCGPKTTGVHVSPDFTHEGMLRGGLGIAGVVSAVEERSAPAGSVDRLDELLRLSIMEEREDLEVQPAGALNAVMGPDGRPGILNSYRTTGSVTPDIMNGVDSLLQSSVRYLVFARIEGDVVKSTTNNAGESITQSSARSVTVSFLVWDLTGACCAWEGRVTGTESNQLSYNTAEEDEDDGGFWESILKGAIGWIFSGGDDEDQPVTWTFPEPPGFEQTVTPVFQEFAGNLPQRK